MKQEQVISMLAIDEGKYKGEWLALDQLTHRVIAHGIVLKDVIREAKEKGCDDPVVHGVPQSDMHFITVN